MLQWVILTGLGIGVAPHHSVHSPLIKFSSRFWPIISGRPPLSWTGRLSPKGGGTPSLILGNEFLAYTDRWIHSSCPLCQSSCYLFLRNTDRDVVDISRKYRIRHIFEHLIRHLRGFIFSDIRRFISRVNRWLSFVDTAFRDFLAINK